MSKRELDNLKRRIGDIAVNIKEQEDIKVQVHDSFRKVHPKRQILQNRPCLSQMRL